MSVEKWWRHSLYQQQNWWLSDDLVAGWINCLRRLVPASSFFCCFPCDMSLAKLQLELPITFLGKSDQNPRSPIFSFVLTNFRRAISYASTLPQIVFPSLFASYPLPTARRCVFFYSSVSFEREQWSRRFLGSEWCCLKSNQTAQLDEVLLLTSEELSCFRKLFHVLHKYNQHLASRTQHKSKHLSYLSLSSLYRISYNCCFATVVI